MSDEVDTTEETDEAEEGMVPYIKQILAGELEGPPFTHVSEDGTFTEYTLDEVIASDKSDTEKRAWLDMHVHNMKLELTQSDYIGIKLAEGAATADEYADKIAERKELRNSINAYQEAMDALNIKETQE